MEFYISPENRVNAENKINRMFKHLEVKPQVTFNPVEQVVKTTITNYAGAYSSDRKRVRIQAIKVEIEDIKQGDWILVATVDYAGGRLLICDKKYFKDIPEQYGLEYTKCDHCGAVHSRRVESHILYNEKTGEWMQVGSTCINKMINGGKYLNKLMINLYEVFTVFFGGCEPEAWHGSYWRPSDRYLNEGIEIEAAISYCLDYMNENGDVWQKAEWNNGVKTPGTNDFLIDKMKNGSAPKADEILFTSIKNYFLAMTRGEDGYDGPTLTQKIIDAFNDDFIALKEMYIAWFAITIYKGTFKAMDFKALIENHRIEKGALINFCGTLEALNQYETFDYYSGQECYSYEAIFVDENTGIKFTKSISHKGVIDKFLCEDGKYRFSAKVKFIAYKRQYVGFGGRLSKPSK